MGGKAQADRLLLAQLLPRLGECWSWVLEEVLTTWVALLEQAFLVQLTALPLDPNTTLTTRPSSSYIHALPGVIVQ